MKNQNEATSLLERMGIKLKNKVTISLGGDVEFTFIQDNASYDAFINEVGMDDKLTPMRDYLLAIVEPTQRNDLAELLAIPGFTDEIMATVRKALVPKINLTVKN